MDTVRGIPLDDSYEFDPDGYISFEDTDDNAIEAPPTLSTDERRMQVRAYNFWTSLLGQRNYPSIEDLDLNAPSDFSEHAVLLDFTSGLENPAIPFLGAKLSAECGIDEPIGYLDQVPPRSLLSRITDHYMQIIANRAPVGFEAEFVNDRGATIMYRGILLPFSSDDDTIDFLYGVINWKEVLPADEAAILELEVSQALAEQPMGHTHGHGRTVPAYADGPTTGALNAPVILAGADDPSDDHGEGAEDECAPDAGLADWLDLARRSAMVADECDGRSRAALYRAIGRAYDFALVAEAKPADYAELLADAGIVAQSRAPMTPVVKLVFGAGYDKTRLTEFAAALHHARVAQVPMRGLATYIERYDGGLKGIVKAERATRRAGRAAPSPVTGNDARQRLRHAPPRDLSDFSAGSEEFVLLVGRREADGSLALVAKVTDPALAARAITRAE